MASLPIPLLGVVLLCLFSAVCADDGAAMLALAKSFNPPPSDWSTTSSSGFCKWTGIRCDSTGRVTSINLADQSISGTLPSKLSSLSQLKTISMQRNLLGGQIPSFSGLSSLQEIYLDNNVFTSIAPKAFAQLTSLQILSLSENQNLSLWSFPSDLTGSPSLTTLYLDNTNINGTLPDIFDSFASLQNLRMSYNILSGPLPKSLAKSMIKNLWINNQEGGFTGTLDVLSNISQLSQAWLHKNQFTGPIPDLSKCTSLFDLQLRDNQLTGILPPSLTSLKSLLNITLDNNKLQGPTPAFRDDVKATFLRNNFCTDKPGLPCDPQVTVLLDLARGLGYPVMLSESWHGNDACDDWPYVNCDASQKIITLNLGKHGFIGTISPAISNLTFLKNLYLNDNKISGPIPDDLAHMPNLQIVDVSNNDLTGKLPKFARQVKFTYQPGNTRLGKSSGNEDSGSNPSNGYGSEDSSKTHARKSLAMIVGIAIAILIFVAIVCFVVFKFVLNKRHGKFGKVRKQKVAKEPVNNGMYYAVGVNGNANGLNTPSSGNNSNRQLLEGGNVTISMEVLRQVTDNFSEENVLGRGGFGVVYKGELHDGTKIAVKRMESVAMGSKGMNEFQAEIAVLSKVRHRHLVALLGYCMNESERLLVYEYMPQGTLAQHLFEWRQLGWTPLTWKQRVTVALDVARGVEYLHSLAQQSFIHRDLKPSNILLGDDMRAKVADFGLVKNAPDGKFSVETRLAGTFGYLAPEYAATGRVTTKVDVYAFGVVLMELITGRKALDDTLPDEKSHLVTWFRRVLINKDNVAKALDDSIDPDEETMASIHRVAELAGHCTAREPYQRPDMGHAVNVLGPLVELWQPSSQEEESFGIDLHMSLPQALQRWQADEGTSSMFQGGMSYSQSQSSIGSKPAGFPESFNSSDCR